MALNIPATLLVIFLAIETTHGRFGGRGSGGYSAGGHGSGGHGTVGHGSIGHGSIGHGSIGHGSVSHATSHGTSSGVRLGSYNYANSAIFHGSTSNNRHGTGSIEHSTNKPKPYEATSIKGKTREDERYKIPAPTTDSYWNNLRIPNAELVGIKYPEVNVAKSSVGTLDDVERKFGPAPGKDASPLDVVKYTQQVARYVSS